MSHLNTNFGIVTERELNRISIFNTSPPFNVLHQIPLDADVIDVDINFNRSKALVVAFLSQRMFQLDLLADPPTFVLKQASTFLEDVCFTPDGKYGVSVDGGTDANLYSYVLQTNDFETELPADAQAVAVSPSGNGLILTARSFVNAVRCYSIDNYTGVVTDTGIEVSTGGNEPINITFTPDGRFAFVANNNSLTIPNGTTIDILKIEPNLTISFVKSVLLDNNPQTIVVSKDGTKVYVLTSNTVDTFDFTLLPSPDLIPISSFNHNLPISSYYRVDQMALDILETKLFVSSSFDSNTGNVLAVFETNGTPLGNVPDVTANGGVAIAPRIPSPRGINFSQIRLG